MTTCQESVQLGAYLLGALDPQERTELEAHVAGCADCQAELVAMAPLPGLLRRTPFEELDETAETAQTLTAPHPSEAPRATPPEPARPPRPAPAHRRPRRRMLVSAGVALAGAAAAVGAWVYVGGAHPGGTTPVSAATTVSAVDARTHVTAAAALTPENWGTQVQLKLGNLPFGITCHLVVHARDGRTETAGTWGSGYSAATTVPASTSIGSSDITSMDVVDGSGNVLVHLSG
ncbi:anti-sigma factor family protein [Streptacidiphilus jiangxiensis]|uniref:Putative zinc-finger n=1 Tax=Streptacidiphilus jiangxiensis TaxID=235985 RepID=A0A1H7GC95_STRJI|nr:zf-HC2 domain-containing protein [Streptacidiphilus jiangxiensis]SEK35883.1 Putative zinc-finger [Streptacidiphilus jiangxiensis]